MNNIIKIILLINLTITNIPGNIEVCLSNKNPRNSINNTLNITTYMHKESKDIMRETRDNLKGHICDKLFEVEKEGEWSQWLDYLAVTRFIETKIDTTRKEPLKEGLNANFAKKYKQEIAEIKEFLIKEKEEGKEDEEDKIRNQFESLLSATKEPVTNAEEANVAAKAKGSIKNDEVVKKRGKGKFGKGALGFMSLSLKKREHRMIVETKEENGKYIKYSQMRRDQNGRLNVRYKMSLAKNPKHRGCRIDVSNEEIKEIETTDYLANKYCGDNTMRIYVNGIPINDPDSWQGLDMNQGYIIEDLAVYIWVKDGRIVIIDQGIGMTFDTMLRKYWVPYQTTKNRNKQRVLERRTLKYRDTKEKGKIFLAVGGISVEEFDVDENIDLWLELSESAEKDEARADIAFTENVRDDVEYFVDQIFKRRFEKRYTILNCIARMLDEKRKKSSTENNEKRIIEKCIRNIREKLEQEIRAKHNRDKVYK